MNRRDALRVLSSAVAVPVLSGLSLEQLFAMGQAVHGRTGGNTLRIFNAHQNETVATIAELIIPATDTPGARAALVNQFIDLIVAEWYTEEERSRFLNGLGVSTRGAAAVSGQISLT